MLHMPSSKKEVRRGKAIMSRLQTPGVEVRIQEANVVEQQ
jgi:hypothetical protein